MKDETANGMRRYIGTKIIEAAPRAKDYGPAEQQGEPGYTVVYPDGYTSWSPKTAFEEAYRPADGLPFGLAVEALKKGKRVTRAGWNGKGMFLVLVPGSQNLTVDEGRPLAKAGVPVGTKFNYLPHIDMFTVQGDFVPWLASQTDILAEDWQVVQ